MVTRSRYQEGSIALVKRSGDDVWVYRWRERAPDGSLVQKKSTIGSIKHYPTLKAVKRAIEPLRRKVNDHLRVDGIMTFQHLWDDFAKVELRDPDVDRAESTIELYEKNAAAHLLPRWGTTPITLIHATDVEAWAKKLVTLPSRACKGGDPLSPAAKAKLVNQMSAMFTHAIRHRKYEGLNPMRSVRRSSKRAKEPGILSLVEMTSLLSVLDQHVIRIAVLIAAVTGLRKSEIRGLKWLDMDAERAVLNLRRGKVKRSESKLKTEASRKPVPIPVELVEALVAWRAESPYPQDDDWMFASPVKFGKEPLWLDHMMRAHITPAAKSLGIETHIGWHTFRRSYSSILISSGAGPKVVQELLRHANIKITLDLYAQANQSEKRAAQEHLKGLFLVPNKRAS